MDNICNPYEIIIQGITSNGKVFRPSDWAERLCGVLSSFNQGHLCYNDLVRPMLADKIRCVAVDRKLEQLNSAMFRFLMDFAHDNDLRILDCRQLMDETEHTDDSDGLSGTVESTSPAPQETVFTVREIAAGDEGNVYGCMARRYPHWDNIENFISKINIMRTQGYRLAGLFEEGRSHAGAVCGFYIRHSLSVGKMLAVCDISAQDERAVRYLVDFLRETAAAEQCIRIEVAADYSAAMKSVRTALASGGFDIAGLLYTD